MPSASDDRPANDHAAGHSEQPELQTCRNGTSTDIFNARSVSEIKSTLSFLHDQESSVTARLDTLVASQKDFSRELGRLHLLRAHLGSQAGTTRSLSHGMLNDAASVADRISSAVRRLDLEQSRVKSTLEVVEQVAELKACVLGVSGSMGAPQDWEMAANYLSRASKIPQEVINGSFAAEIVPTAEVPDPPNVTLDNAAESLCALFLREFEKAVDESSGSKITRFFKLFPLIGRPEVGLNSYSRYVCQGVASRARANLHAGTGGSQSKDGFFYANTITKLFEHIAQIIDGHGGLVERHYGAGKMIRVVELLQVEADVQGGIILETWTDERNVDRKLTDIKSYAFTFLVQSFLPGPRAAGTPRANSPANRDGANARASEDEGVDMKEIDGLLGEMADFQKADGSETDLDSTELRLPSFLIESALAKKVNDRLISPFNAMTTFFLRRSVEKAFQLDEQPSGLTLQLQQPIHSNPPHITSVVDDIMYIVNKVLQQSLGTSQAAVVTNVVPTLARVLGSDFIGMIRRKMRDESYPKASVQGAQPPEQTVVAFLVLINNLDIAVDYIHRITKSHLEPSGDNSSPDHGDWQQKHDTTAGVGNSQENIISGKEDRGPSHLIALFPFSQDAMAVSAALHSLSSSFESKANELLVDGIQVVFNNVVKNRLRPMLSDAFRDTDYQPQLDQNLMSPEDHDADGEDGNEGGDGRGIVRLRFASTWSDILVPLWRILTASAFDRLLTVTIAYLSRLLEKRLWTYHGRVNALGATKLERDVAGIVDAAIDVEGTGSGPRNGGAPNGIGGKRYRHREAFDRCLQMVLVMGMEEDEWEEIVSGGGDLDVINKLNEEERERVRAMVRFG
ncbi:hypothetical protein FQN54_001011 [Arachnomyces sp. PD_36]|nr:hypothetical protein FQN54_001011 [Arachnomyces sp. PD_36]